MSGYHTPVLLGESVNALVTNPSGIYIDATFGGGGHTAAILSRLAPEGKIIAFDKDKDAMKNRPDDRRFTLIHSDFRYMHNFLMLEGLEYNGDRELKADGILADLGVSSHQFDTAERGFSFRFDAPLDMRMNTGAKTTAADIVNGYSQDRLENIFRLYGEVNQPGRIARLIVNGRQDREILTTAELNGILKPALPEYAAHKTLAKIYQALRIEANHEMRSLEKFLEGCIPALKKGGHLVVITYHSIEDRMVKNFMKTGNISGEVAKDFYGNVSAPLKPLTRKPVLPQESEISSNTRARSAKLRVAERTNGN